ncbi:MAG: glycosyltransferase family protein [Candidatus Omnitrophota bacterium]|nr:glycosyltransferase family protein [Candidatus Omnitrophota bacterium]MDZ4241972.1 glycosyltransferase family protein [Candidatus Omnitrophota bacterium]
MKTRQRLLFIVNGLGMGNSTRCYAVMRELMALGYGVDVLTSGNGYDFFRQRHDIGAVHLLRSLYYGKRGKRLSILYTFLAFPHFIWILLKNMRIASEIIRGGRYRAIVIDSDYTLLLLRPFLRVPVIAVNNADVIVAEYQKAPKPPCRFYAQFLIERMDLLFHRLVPDLVLSPWLEPRTAGDAKFWPIPVIVRGELEVRPASPVLKNILVMLTGSQFKAFPAFLERLKEREGVHIDVLGCDGPSRGWITFHGKVRDNIEILNRADLMVINGGFSAVSEAVALRKPAVVVPVEHHAEQFVNAAAVERLGLGLAATPEDVTDKINFMVEHFPLFVSRHQESPPTTPGRQKAAGVIHAFLNRVPGDAPRVLPEEESCDCLR